jgi:hypothetical protein
MRLAIHAGNALIDMTAMRSPQAAWAGITAASNSRASTGLRATRGQAIARQLRVTMSRGKIICAESHADYARHGARAMTR